MLSPVKPSDFKELIVQPEDNLCAALVKVLIRLPILYYKLLNYERTSGGDISDDYAAELCPRVYPTE